MEKKIKMLSDQSDIKDAKKVYKKGDIIDLGNERNTAAVKSGKAVWHETEKKEGTPKKTTSSAKETK